MTRLEAEPRQAFVARQRHGAFSRGIGADRFVVAAPPAGPAGRFFYFGGNGYAINAASKVKEAAWEYLSFLLSPEINGLLNREWGAIPGNVRAWGQEWLAGPAFGAPKAMVEQPAALIRYPNHLREWPQWFLTLCPASIQKALLGQQTARQHVEAVAPVLETALAKAG